MGQKGYFGRWMAASILGGLLLGASAPAYAKSAIVVSTIRPINSLVAAVMDGVGTSTSLVPSNESPEFFLLHDQDERALRQVDLIFWVGDSSGGTYADHALGFVRFHQQFLLPPY